MQISQRASAEPWAGPQEDGAQGIEVGVDLPDTVAVRATAVLDTTSPADFISPTARNGCRHSLSSEMGAGRTSACCATGARHHGAAPLLPPSSWWAEAAIGAILAECEWIVSATTGLSPATGANRVVYMRQVTSKAAAGSCCSQ